MTGRPSVPPPHLTVTQLYLGPAEPAELVESTLPPELEPAFLKGYFDIKSNYRFLEMSYPPAGGFGL